MPLICQCSNLDKWGKDEADQLIEVYPKTLNKVKMGEFALCRGDGCIVLGDCC